MKPKFSIIIFVTIIIFYISTPSEALLGNPQKSTPNPLLNGLGQALEDIGKAVSGGNKPNNNNNCQPTCPRGQPCRKCPPVTGGNLGDLGNAVDKAGKGLVNAANGVLNNIAKGVGPLANGLGNALNNLTKGLGPLANGLRNGLKPVVGSVGSALSALTPILNALGSVVGGLVGGLVQLVATLLALVLNLLAEILTLLSPEVNLVLTSLFSVLSSVGSEAGNLLTGVDQLVSSLLLPILEALAEILGQLKPDVANVLGSLFSTINNVGKDVQNAVNNRNAIKNSCPSCKAKNTTKIPCMGPACMSKCPKDGCDVYCLQKGCKVNNVKVDYTFSELLIEARKFNLAYAGTVMGLPNQAGGIISGDLGEMLSQAGFNPMVFSGKIGTMPGGYLNGLFVPAVAPRTTKRPVQSIPRPRQQPPQRTPPRAPPVPSPPQPKGCPVPNGK